VSKIVSPRRILFSISMKISSRLMLLSSLHWGSHCSKKKKNLKRLQF
jgi:hypothetical protein